MPPTARGAEGGAGAVVAVSSSPIVYELPPVCKPATITAYSMLGLSPRNLWAEKDGEVAIRATLRHWLLGLFASRHRNSYDSKPEAAALSLHRQLSSSDSECVPLASTVGAGMPPDRLLPPALGGGAPPKIDLSQASLLAADIFKLDSRAT